jgi:hypothetical protein
MYLEFKLLKVKKYNLLINITTKTYLLIFEIRCIKKEFTLNLINYILNY